MKSLSIATPPDVEGALEALGALAAVANDKPDADAGADAGADADRAAIEDAVAELIGTVKLDPLDARRVFGDDSLIATRCEIVASVYKIPVTVPVLVALGMRSVGCADRVRGRIWDPHKADWWAHPLHLWVLGELAPSIGKTALLVDLGHANVTGFAKRVAEAWQDVAHTDKVRRRKAERAATVKNATEDELKAIERLKEKPVHKTPDPLQDRSTPADHRWTMLDAGCTWTIQAEGSEHFEKMVFKELLVNDSNDAFSGARVSASTRKDRREGNIPMFEEVHHTFVLLPQPGTFSPKKAEWRDNLIEAATTKGHLARYLCADGHSGDMFPRGRYSEAEIESNKAAYFADLETFFAVDTVRVGMGDETPGLERHPLAPRRVSSTGEQEYAGFWVEATKGSKACEMLLAYQDKHKSIGAELREEASTLGLTDPCAPLHNRIGELAVRTAELLALIRVGGVDAVMHHGVCAEVTEDEAERAIYLCDTLIPHAVSMLNEATLGETEGLVRRAVQTLAIHGKMTEKRLFASHAQHWPELRGRSTQSKCSVTVALVEACKRGFIVETKGAREKYFDLSPSAKRAVSAAVRPQQEAA